jgi:2TM domain
MESAPLEEKDLTALAAAQLEKKQDFAIHVAAYLAVNALLVVIWAIADGGDFWPIVPIVAWGVGLALHAWSVFGRNPMTPGDQISAEAERLRAKGVGR